MGVGYFCRFGVVYMKVRVWLQQQIADSLLKANCPSKTTKSRELGTVPFIHAYRPLITLYHPPNAA